MCRFVAFLEEYSKNSNVIEAILEFKKNNKKERMRLRILTVTETKRQTETERQRE